MPKKDLTAERLREVLVYDEATGLFTWRINVSRKTRAGRAAGVVSRGRMFIGIDGAHYFAHRLAWLYVHGGWPSKEIDHINGDPLDNRLTNLRDVPHRINLQNMRRPMKTSALGILGVSRNSNGKNYRARIGDRHLGTFTRTGDASAAYVKAKRETHAGCTL